MSTVPAPTPQTVSAPASDHRGERRQPVSCSLWMIDHEGSTVLQCRCMDMSKDGMRLRVPLGYGVAEGQRYELRSHLPGEKAGPGFNVIGSRWATVVWAEMELDATDEHVDIGVALDQADAPLSWSVRPGAA